MPLVEVWHTASVHIWALQNLRKKLPTIVAGALHVESNPSFHLTPGDICIRFRQFDELDVHARDVEITVTALYSEERERRLEEGINEMETGVRAVLGDFISFFVFPLLPHGAFKASEGSNLKVQIESMVGQEVAITLHSEEVTEGLLKEAWADTASVNHEPVLIERIKNIVTRQRTEGRSE